MIGQKISHYKITEKLGEGGMGVVYKAEDTKLKRTVALKFLPPHAVENAEDKARFTGEAQAAAALDHPNICTVYEINEADGQSYIAMAYVEGQSVKELIDAGGPFKLVEAARIAVQIAKGLAAAHEKGIVHRDVKSANVMVTPRGEAKIMDFGLAHQTDVDGPSSDSSTLGTVAYGSPEQTRGDGVDYRTDIWSFGITLYEMLTGRLPFSGDYESAIRYSVLNETPEPPSAIRSEVPKELDAIVARMLEKDPSARYQKTEDLVEDLRALRDDVDPTVTSRRAAHQEEERSWLQRLTERHVLLAAGLYVIASFIIVKVVGVIAGRLMLSPELVNTVMVGLLSLIPTVMLLAYFLGRRGVRASKKPMLIGIPTNMIATGALLAVMFSGKNLGAATTTVSVTDEEGTTVERVVPKGAFRKDFALYLFENQTGNTDHDWVQYALPLLIEFDVYQDSFVQARSAFNRSSFKRLEDSGFESWVGAPLALKRKIAGEFHQDHFVTGAIREAGGSYTIEIKVHETESGKTVSQLDYHGDDIFELVDEISAGLKRAVGVPAWHMDNANDLSVADMTTTSVEAIKETALAQKVWVFDQDWEGATKHSERAVQLDSTMASVHFDLHQLYKLSNEMDKGTASLQACMRHLYKLPERHQFIIKANYYYFKQQPEKAYAVIKMMVDLYPDDLSGYQALGAIANFRGETDKAIEAYEKILELDPFQYQFLQHLAGMHKQKGDFETALSYYQKFAKLNPSNPRSFGPIGSLHEQLGEYEKARENYEKALLIEPELVSIMVSVGTVELELGNFDKALEQYQEALKAGKKPEDRITVYHAIERYYEMRGQIDTALEYMRKRFAEADVIQAPMFTQLQQLENLDRYVLIGQPQRAFDVLESVKENIKPPFDKAMSFGYLNVYIETEDPDAAEKELAGVDEYIESFKIEMLRPIYTTAVGRISELRGEYDSAIQTFEKVLKEHPTETKMHYRMGRCYRLAGNHAEAEKQLKMATRLHPSDPNIHYELSLLYNATSRRDLADHHLNLALSVWKDADPAYVTATDARETRKKWDAASSM